MSTLVLIALALPAIFLLVGVLAGATPSLYALRSLLSDERGTVDNFIPAIWSARILAALRPALVYASDLVANRDYEGEIAQAGDRVHINSVGDPTIFDYTKNTDMPAAEELTDDQRTLVVTESRGFNFQLDDVDAAQARGAIMNQAMQNAAFGLRDQADQFAAGHHTDVDAANLLGADGSPISIASASDAYDNLVELGVVLDEADVPTDRRFVVVPPWYHGLLLQDDRFVSFGTSDNRATLENGMVGAAAGFTIAKTNNVPIGDEGLAEEHNKVIAGYPGALSYAEQIPPEQTEAYRPERRFADAVKGLHLYGAHLVRTDGWAVLSAQDNT